MYTKIQSKENLKKLLLFILGVIISVTLVKPGLSLGQTNNNLYTSGNWDGWDKDDNGKINLPTSELDMVILVIELETLDATIKATQIDMESDYKLNSFVLSIRDMRVASTFKFLREYLENYDIPYYYEPKIDKLTEALNYLESAYLYSSLAYEVYDEDEKQRLRTEGEIRLNVGLDALDEALKIKTDYTEKEILKWK